jgi:two-component system, LuxR family, response regulator FixJ
MSESPKNIFVVDDDFSFGKSLTRLLGARGYLSEYFSSAQSFLDSVTPDQQGVAILDIHMPNYDGFALFDKLKELHYCLDVIFVTGQAQTDDRNHAREKGSRGFLQKPFSETSLFELLPQAEGEGA